MFDLDSLGWSSHFEGELRSSGADASLFPARISEVQRSGYRLISPAGECAARPTGRLLHEAARGELRPTTGDWVLATDAGDGTAVVHRVLARRSQLVRRAVTERTEDQVVAANVDVVFVVQSVNRDFNPRRIERTLALVWESGARPVVVLNKADLCSDLAPFVAEAEAVAPGVPVHAVSAVAEHGLAPIEPYLARGVTAALIGSSGVGKSTIVNTLAGGERMRVGAIRADDDRGRHTTTTRQLVVLPGGALLLDTPGIRTVALTDAEDGMTAAFDDIEALAAGCRFSDCAHEAEPGCAVRAALAAGTLDAARYRSYLKLRAERRYAARRNDVALRIAEVKRWKRIHVAMRARPDKRR